MKEEKDKTVIEIGNKILTLSIHQFNGEIDLEQLLQVDMNAIFMEILTFPVVFNNIGFLKAEVDDLLRKQQYDFKHFEAECWGKHKKDFVSRGEKTTETALENAVILDPQYKVKKYELFDVQKLADKVDALYWAAKSKDQKLNAISAKLQPEEFGKEILEKWLNKVYNFVHVASQKNLFPQGRK